MPSTQPRTTSLTTDLLNNPSLQTLWEASTKTHPFLTSLSHNNLTPHQFNSWLVQDYIFAVYPFRYILQYTYNLLVQSKDNESLRSYNGRTLDTLKTLLEEGIQSAEKEGQFFQHLAQRRGVELPDVSVPRSKNGEINDYLCAIRGDATDLAKIVSPALKEYSEFLLDEHSGEYSEGRPVEVLTFILWVLEKCYLDAWRNISEALHRFPERNVDKTILFACSWWVNDRFQNYVDRLGGVIDALGQDEALGKLNWEQAQKLCNRVLELEDGFWGMAFGEYNR